MPAIDQHDSGSTAVSYCETASARADGPHFPVPGNHRRRRGHEQRSRINVGWLARPGITAARVRKEHPSEPGPEKGVDSGEETRTGCLLC